MAGKRQMYRRQTKKYQQNLYKANYSPDGSKDRTKMKWISIFALVAPGVLCLISFCVGKYFLLMLAIWIICIAAVFINAVKEQHKYVKDLKSAGMPKKEFAKMMKMRTKSEGQYRRMMRLWDSVEIK